MPENPNLFDDDSLLPDWMRDSASEPSASDDFSLEEDAPGAFTDQAGSAAPWDTLRGETPGRPAGLTEGAPPWETLSGDRAPAPRAPRAVAPWDALAGPESDRAGSLDDLRAELTAYDQSDEDEPLGLNAAFDWDAETAHDQPALTDSDELPRGMTDFLPWREEAAREEPPQPIAPFPAELAGLSDEQFTIDQLIDEFQSDAPVEAEEPVKAPSLRDRLRSLSPQREESPAVPSETDEPRPLSPEESEWMSAFGQAADYSQAIPADPGSDLDWLGGGEPTPLPGAEEAGSSLANEFDTLFGDDFAAQMEQEPIVSADEVEPASGDDFATLFGEEFAAPASGELGEISEEPEGEPRSLAEWLETDADDFDEVPPEDAETPPEQPPQEEKPRTGLIRRLKTAPLPEPEPDTEGVPDWVTSADLPAGQGPAPDTGGLTYEEWERQQQERAEAAQRPPKDDLLETVPEWFDKIDSTPPLPVPPTPSAPTGEGPEFVPGWFMGLEEKQDEQAPDWFRRMDLSTGPLTGPLTSPEPEQPASGAPDVPDWFKMPDLPLPGMDDRAAGLGPESADFAESEIPDWLAAAAPGGDVVARPEDVPFPEIDLDQTMPGLTVPPDMARQRHSRIPQLEDEEPPNDFVERFEPIEPDYAPVRAPVDQQAPDWLREMAVEAGMPIVNDDDLEFPGETFSPRRTPADDSMDWLNQISADDLAAEEDASWSEPEDQRHATSERDAFDSAALDSAALNALLGISDSDEEPARAWGEPFPAESDTVDDLFETLDQEGDAEPIYEVTGVADLGPGPDDDLPDLTELFEQMPTAGEKAPDLGLLFDQGELDRVLGEESPAAQEPVEPAFPPEETRALPTAPPRFGRFRKRKGMVETGHGSASPDEELPAQVEPQPEWVDELRPSELPVTVHAGGMEANIKQKQVLELPERLQAFRETAMRELRQPEPQAAPPQSGTLAGVSAVLPIADVVLPSHAVPRRVEQLVITPDQQRRVARLQALLDQVAAQEEEVEEDRAGLADAELIAMGLEPGEEVAPSAQARRERRRRRFKLDRVLVTLLMLVAVIAPFATDALHFAADPPPLTGSRLVVADAIYALLPGDYVLVAFEYGPTAAGELDGLAQAVLRDVLAHRAIPLTTSTNPAGAFHAAAVLSPLAVDPALLTARGQRESELVSGKDFVLLSYLSGEAIGVRDLRNASVGAASTLQQQPFFSSDLRGEKTDLPISSVENNIALIIVIAEDSDAVRLWAEQLQGMAVPKIALVTAAAEPLTTPYVSKDGYAGYLAGVRDTYSYNKARNGDSLAPYILPDDLPVTVPNPEESRWHSMALGAAAAALLIVFGMFVNLFPGIGTEATPLTPHNLDLIAGWVSLVLTLLVFSYLLGDNVLYRIAVHILVGVAVAYTVIVATESVLWPWLRDTLLADADGRDNATMAALRVVGMIPFLFGVLLLFKFSPRLAPVGNLGTSLLIGVGLAVAIAGAVSGTIVPLAREAGEAVGGKAGDGLVILVGVITTLIYFQFLAVERRGNVRRPRWLQGLAGIGQLFVTLALGALYAGAILTSLAIFSDVILKQLEFILDRVGG